MSNYYYFNTVSRSVFLDFIHRLVSNKPKIIRPWTNPPPKKTKKPTIKQQTWTDTHKLQTMRKNRNPNQHRIKTEVTTINITHPEYTNGNKTAHDVSETGSVSVLRWKHIRGTYSVIGTQDRLSQREILEKIAKTIVRNQYYTRPRNTEWNWTPDDG
jgi:hypothetical protein